MKIKVKNCISRVFFAIIDSLHLIRNLRYCIVNYQRCPAKIVNSSEMKIESNLHMLMYQLNYFYFFFNFNFQDCVLRFLIFPRRCWLGNILSAAVVWPMESSISAGASGD
jgi:hypothetical protein